MSVALLDVNVLISLFDPAHPNHDSAHDWFAKNRKTGWATCMVTVNGCVRILSNPAYPSFDATPAEVVAHLRTLCSAREHVFWREGVSMLDTSLFKPELIAGHQKLTDAYLLGMAVRHSGRLASFDKSIPRGAVAGAQQSHIELIR